MRVAPFKSQNMALNSYITAEGLEMGRAQAVQAQAACIEPSVLMNPILLKPCSETGSQVIVNGEVAGTMQAAEYYAYRQGLRHVIRQAYEKLCETYELIVIEGAGSPAEINLNQNDLVNMGIAEMFDAPVLLVADIDRGGVFAQIYGTIMLLPAQQRRRIRGVIVNKFRGDPEILRPGLKMIEELTGVPVLGVVPYLDVDIDEEDSVIQKENSAHKPLEIAVIRFPRISNATDFNPLARLKTVHVRYVRRASEFSDPDMVILPGTKSTMADLIWMRQNGLESLVKKTAAKGVPVLGICGGYQMLGNVISDSDGVEGGGTTRGLGLLPVDTVFEREKTRLRSEGTVNPSEGVWRALAGAPFGGYQIHMGKTAREEGVQAFCTLSDGAEDGAVFENVAGTYMHGFFDGDTAAALEKMLLARRGITPDEEPCYAGAAAFLENQYETLADALRNCLDMDAIVRLLDGQEEASEK
jgi:adenosylcobyric acid synthase